MGRWGCFGEGPEVLPSGGRREVRPGLPGPGPDSPGLSAAPQCSSPHPIPPPAERLFPGAEGQQLNSAPNAGHQNAKPQRGLSANPASMDLSLTPQPAKPKTHQPWVAGFPSLVGVPWLLCLQKSHQCQAPGLKPPSEPPPPPQCPHLKALKLPGPVILGAFLVLCLLLQPLQPLSQQLLVQLGCVSVSLGCLQGLSQPLGLGRGKMQQLREVRWGQRGGTRPPAAERNIPSLILFRIASAR